MKGAVRMSTKRRDSKGRILRNGESQRKDGRYAYKYVGLDGKNKFVYSWKLEPTDKMPKGKRADISLREKEKMIRRDIEDGINSSGGDMTVTELVEKYLKQKVLLKYNSQTIYKYMVDILKADEFGSYKISKVKESDAKEWFIQLKQEGRGYASIELMKSIIGPAFSLAIKDDLLRHNPFDFKLSLTIKDDRIAKQALTKEQETSFLNFIKNDTYAKQFYDAVYILFHTGLRISEFAGLTISDIDFNNGYINIDHQLLCTRDGEKYISTAKTDTGKRRIPMSEEVKKCFERILSQRETPIHEPVISDISNFIHLHKGVVWVRQNWYVRFVRMWKKYNEIHDEKIPKVTPHICRHTFCTNLIRSGLNPKKLQYLMGHSNIITTLNIYAHIESEDLKDEYGTIDFAA